MVDPLKLQKVEDTLNLLEKIALKHTKNVCTTAALFLSKEKTVLVCVG